MSAEVHLTLLPDNYQTVVQELQDNYTELKEEHLDDPTPQTAVRLGRLENTLSDLGAPVVFP